MVDKGVSGELTLRSNGESVHLPDIPQPVISALHEAVIGVRDHIEVFKYRLIAIRIEDIRQIYEMLSQWTHQYNIQSQLTQIIAEHRNAEVGSTTSRKNFRSIEDFLRYDDSNIDPVKLLTVRFSFILKNPNTQRLESYDLTLEFPEAADWRPDLLKQFQLLLNRQGFPRGLVCDSSCSGGSRNAQALVCRYSRPLPEAF